MDERRIHIDEFFRRQMDNQSETPPPPVWDVLEKRLDNPHGRKKTFPVWWFWTIIGLVFISAAGILADVYMDSASLIADVQKNQHVQNNTTSYQDIKTPVVDDNTMAATTGSEPVTTTLSKNEPHNEEKDKPVLPVNEPQVNQPITKTTDNNQTEQSTIGTPDGPAAANPIAVKPRVTPMRIANSGLNTIANPAGFDKHFSNVTTPSAYKLKDEMSTLPPGKTQNLAGRNTTPANHTFNNVPLPSAYKLKDEVSTLPAGKTQNIEANTASHSVPSFSNVPLPSTYKLRDEVGTLATGKTLGIPGNYTLPSTPVFNHVQLPQLAKLNDELNVLKSKELNRIAYDNPMLFDANFSKVILPSAYRYKDEVATLPSRRVPDIDYEGPLPVTERQAVAPPSVTITFDEENVPADNTSSDNASIAGPDITKLLAAVNPMSTARTIAGGAESLNIPSPLLDMDADVTTKDEAQAKVVVMQDTSFRKKSYAADSLSMLQAVTAKPDVTRKKLKLPIEAGIKMGFSNGFDRTWNANKFIIAPYIEAQLPSRFSLIVQPSYQNGKVKSGMLNDNTRSYHEKTGTAFNAKTNVVRGAVDSSILTPNPPDTVYRTYMYTQMYDSVRVIYGVKQQQQWDVELPLVVKYKINKNFAVMAGGSVTYSSVLQMKEEIKRYSGLKREYAEAIAPQTFYVTSQGQKPPDGPEPKRHDDLFTFGTDPFSAYKPRVINETNNFFRYGFMIGASAVLKERWMIDVMLHKTGVDTRAVQEKQLQRIYTQPYLRITVGYKLYNN